MKKLLIILFCLVILAITSVAGLYFDKFGIGYFETASDWGAVGDFFGGMLNPIFALISIVLLTYTLSQNKKALEQSQIALNLNNEELRISGEALESSSKALQLQNIGSTFFNMLTLHNNISDNLSFDKLDLITALCSQHSSNTEFKIYLSLCRQNKRSTGRGTFEDIIKILTFSAPSPQEFHKIIKNYKTINNNYNYILGHYFRNLFQLMKFIDTYSDGPVPNLLENAITQKKNFMKMLRAQLSSGELELLLLNCTEGMVDSGEFRNLLIKYEMLKHISIVNSSCSAHAQYVRLSAGMFIQAKDFLHFSDIKSGSAFGDNPTAKKFIIDYKNHLQTQNKDN